MDKRRSPRYALSLDALVHPERGRSWLCSIRDFCIGGMLLSEQESTRVRRTAPVGKPGETVGIHFSIPTSAGEQHFRLEGQIVRVLQDGLGISFKDDLDENVMTHLLAYSNKAPLDSKSNRADQDQTDQNKAAPADKEQAPQRRNLALNGARATPPGKSADATADPDLQPDQDTTPVEQRPEKALEPVGDIDVEDATRIIAACRQHLTKAIAEIIPSFFEYMDKELIRLAGAAANNALQDAYFVALNTLEQSKAQAEKDINEVILDQIDHPREVDDVLSKRQALESERRQKQESQRIKLSLVNTDEFEDWLSVSNIISHTERYFENYLVEIQSRLGMLVDSWAHNEVNPFCPDVITRAFDDVFRQVVVTKNIRELIYVGYESTAVPVLRNLYVSISTLLEDSELFPDMDDHYFTPGPVKIPDETGPADPEVVQEEDSEDAEAEYILDDELESSPQAPGRHPDGRSQGRRTAPQSQQYDDSLTGEFQSGSQPVQQAPRSGYEERRASYLNRNRAEKEIGRVLKDLFSTIHTLMSPQSGPDEAFAGEEYTTDEVRNVLSELQNLAAVGSNRLPVREQIQQRMAQQGITGHLSPGDSQNLEVLENLVDTIKQDSLVSGATKGWIRQLELTLGRVATQNPDFLDSEPPHPALEVVNQLAQLGAAESGSIKRNVDDVVQGIIKNYDGQDEIFESALGELNPLVERQSRAFRGNVQRTVKVSEGQQTLVFSQQAVIDELDRRFSGRQIPEILMKLLMPGWRNLLVNTHLRQGEKSADWKRNLHVLDQLLLHLDEDADASQSRAYMEPELLIKQIETGLDAISYEPGQRAPLIGGLKELLAEGADVSAAEFVEIPEEGMAESLGLGALQEESQTRAEIRVENEADPEWQTWYDRAKNLFVGEWLEFVSDAREAEVAIVAWVSDQVEKFVFVNRRGVQSHEMSVEQLASAFNTGEARIVPESDIPLSDRASHRMLQNMHNQLTHQATHDELTGLINRKEFEHHLDIALKQVKKQDRTDVVAYLDLDQFKIINNTSGHDAGDLLLKDLAKLLNENIDGDDCLLARLGGDEFGILLPDCTETRSMAVLQNILDEVRAFRFDYEGIHYSLTTSIGCVIVDAQTDSVLQIMRAADSACYAAKDAGRDRIQVFEQGDDDLARRTDIMEFVAQIDQALENNRFVLNGQMIAPVDTSAGELPHYEVLLTVLNAEGEPMPPQDFVVAAETYNRMGAIDRWVIENAFNWISENYLQLAHLDAFSINISGNSLNDDDFMDFVIEQFDRTHLPTSKVCFEITETAAVNSLDGTIEFMEKMKVIGCEFSLDDFGTGLSSYSYLRDLPVDYLKIDGIFVKDIVNSPNDYAVVKSINEIGHFMGKKTIAEYVENDEILNVLAEIGVDYAQGYGVGMKIPLDQLLEK